MASLEEDRSEARSILKELIANQYQAIVLGGAALASIITFNPLPMLVWLGGELILLPILDSGPLRRMVARRRLARARQESQSRRAHLIASLNQANQRRYGELVHLCRLIEANYQGLHGISAAYLSEQGAKLDMILHSCAHRMLAIQRYELLLVNRNSEKVENDIERLERELADPELNARARAAIQKNLELKRKLLTSLSDARGTIKALATELDSLASLLEVLHQNSISMRDPQAVSQELDTIVRQSEESERIVREMESLLGSAASDWAGAAAAPIPGEVIVPPLPIDAPPTPERPRRKARER